MEEAFIVSVLFLALQNNMNFVMREKFVTSLKIGGEEHFSLLNVNRKCYSYCLRINGQKDKGHVIRKSSPISFTYFFFIFGKTIGTNLLIQTNMFETL